VVIVGNDAVTVVWKIPLKYVEYDVFVATMAMWYHPPFPRIGEFQLVIGEKFTTSLPDPSRVTFILSLVTVPDVTEDMSSKFPADVLVGFHQKHMVITGMSGTE
jgi:hypothetical protein